MGDVVGSAMVIGAAATVAGVWSVRALAHRALLRGLRAPRVPHAPDAAEGHVPAVSVREVHLTGPRGRRLFGWWVLPSPSDRPAASHRVPAVLVMHGWGSNASMMWPVVPPLHAAGFGVLLIDARCHGHSDDDDFTSLPRFAEDIAAGLVWLRDQSLVDPDRLSLMGHSVGAGAALLHAARRGDVRAVVSLSAFAHPREMMRRFLAEKRVPYPVLGWLVMRHVQRVIGASFDEIAPLSTLTRVRCPVLLVHGRADTTVPFTDAQRLQAASPRARLLAVDGDHDLRQALPPHAAAITRFLREACGLPAGGGYLATPGTGGAAPGPRGGHEPRGDPAPE